MFGGIKLIKSIQEDYLGQEDQIRPIRDMAIFMGRIDLTSIKKIMIGSQALGLGETPPDIF